MLKILLIEDEPRLNEHLKKGLAQQGYSVDSVLNGADGLNYVTQSNYDLIILDLMLPGQNGFQVLENLKTFGLDIPVIIISALSHSEKVIEGLDKGAIDYIKKPFDFGEFLARVRAATRKPGTKNVTLLKFNQIEMDLIKRKVFLAENEIQLTKREFMLLEFLLGNVNRVVSKTEIAEKVWEVNFDMHSNVIEVHLSQLRKKIGEDVIQTRVGLGYCIEGNLIRK
ncbi:MAG: response regulator transcription factor [Chryseotalea sp.]|jgi:DNA-binding response OmpR family regulator|nr:response regulator transcription factor [Flammeovirgaceae bacterium]MCZ8022504.1 response regulator transcription factor [Cytophagales bacterium]